MTSSFKKVSHVIFDMDGTLLDTEDLYAKMIAEIAAKYDSEYPRCVRMEILGTTTQRTAEIAVKELNLPITPDEFVKQFEELGRQRLEEANILPGVEKLMRHLDNENVPFALATSSSKKSTEIKSRHHQELFNLLIFKVMGSSDPEVKNGKPSPDIFLVTASRFPDNPDPSMCLVFEDTPNGVKGAVAAGMQVVMIPHDCVSRDLCNEATLVIDSLLDFKPEDFGLPPYKD